MSSDSSATDPNAFWRALLHRWFVQYNPLYLVSALSVLVGLTMITHASHGPTLDGETEVPGLVAEVYAFSLIGGAWLLRRLGQRRPAVMLGLLAALYQGDLTLLIERSADLRAAGAMTSALWLGAFALKLHLLARVFRLRVSRAASVLPLVGAAALIALPKLTTANVDAGWFGRWNVGAGGALALAVFGAGLFTAREVTSDEPLDAWGETVLRRSLSAVWALWSLLFVAHFAFIGQSFRVHAIALAPLVLLVVARFARRAATVGVAAAAFLVAAATEHRAFALAALAAGVILGLRALRTPRAGEAAIAAISPPQAPYRVVDADADEPHVDELDLPAGPPRFEFAPRLTLLRLLAASVGAFYLAIWTFGWNAGAPFPAHVLALDIAFALALTAGILKLKVRSLALPIVATFAHAVVQARLVAAPTTGAGWGAAAIGAGFGLLALSLAVSYALARPRPSTS